MMVRDTGEVQPALLLVSLLLWMVPVTHQQILSRYFAAGVSVDVAAVSDPLRVTWTNVSATAMCSAYCVQRQCNCVAFSFVNGSCHMFAKVLSGPSGTDKGFNKVTECASAKVLPNTQLLSYTGCSATYTCNYGYEPQTSDSSTLTCTTDETWATSGYRCDLIPCQQPPQLPNAYVAVTTLRVGTYADYSCDTDYTRRGGTTSQLTCLLGGTWSGVADIVCKPTFVSCTVTVKTGTSISAGTDADIFVTLYGNYGDTTINFDSDDYSFEEGDTESKWGTCYNVGPLTHIKVGHDDSGVGPGWEVDWVNVNLDGIGYSISVDTWIEDSPYHVTRYV